MARKVKEFGIILGRNSTEEVADSKKAWLFVSRCKTTYCEVQLKNYLRSLHPNNDFIVRKEKNLGHFNTFKVDVYTDVEEKLIDPNL